MVTTEQMKALVKTNLNINDKSKDLIISDVIQDALNYCNLNEPPITLEPYIRKKVQTIINYESEYGTSVIFDVKSVSEGDTSITYNVDSNYSREAIYGLSEADKKVLKHFRRTRK